MAFVPYPSIENDYREKLVDRIKVHFDDDDWIATEKIHGANFSAIVSTDSETGEIRVVYAKRSGVIAPHEKFFNHRRIDERHRAAFVIREFLKDAFADFVKEYPEAEESGALRTRVMG